MGYRHELFRAVTLNGIASWEIIPSRYRWRVLRAFGLDIDAATISPGVWFGSKRVSIGRATFINRECMFSTHAPITIGENVDIGMRVSFITAGHEIGTERRRAGAHVTAPIVVESGVWIGAGATVLPGVTIGRGAVIAAGAVVTADCEPNALYAGVPARLVRALDPA
ncbi:DapH/DapD/GlmU-related protein [Microbacterium tumbae]